MRTPPDGTLTRPLSIALRAGVPALQHKQENTILLVTGVESLALNAQVAFLAVGVRLHIFHQHVSTAFLSVEGRKEQAQTMCYQHRTHSRH